MDLNPWPSCCEAAVITTTRGSYYLHYCFGCCNSLTVDFRRVKKIKSNQNTVSPNDATFYLRKQTFLYFNDNNNRDWQTGGIYNLLIIILLPVPPSPACFSHKLYSSISGNQSDGQSSVINVTSANQRPCFDQLGSTGLLLLNFGGFKDEGECFIPPGR